MRITLSWKVQPDNLIAVTYPVLYSFRRCPYAMRARLALVSAKVPVELREVGLREKPEAFSRSSPSKTVPCLVTDGVVIDESLDVMVWALEQNDPERWLNMPRDGWNLIERCDGPYKRALDRTKYATRYPDANQREEREHACEFLRELDAQLDSFLFGRKTLADTATLPFVRQFAFIDKPWFDAQEWPKLQRWLNDFLTSRSFATIMPKFGQWHQGDVPVVFP